MNYGLLLSEPYFPEPVFDNRLTIRSREVNGAITLLFIIGRKLYEDEGVCLSECDYTNGMDSTRDVHAQVRNHAQLPKY